MSSGDFRRYCVMSMSKTYQLVFLDNWSAKYLERGEDSTVFPCLDGLFVDSNAYFVEY